MSRAIAPPATESAGGREVASMMDELDTDRDGYVDLGEFAAFHGHGRGQRELDAELRDSFDVDDINDDGRISDTELNKVVVWFSTGYITIKDMVVTGMPIKIVGVAALTVLLPTLEDDP
ncbi:hypothetical protein ZWY2020_034067 [Hordeum vulgare]|nr:hypothetical protein ZWY2020_034067 [Hordeum vulgare]